jgi:hypothetical protein
MPRPCQYGGRHRRQGGENAHEASRHGDDGGRHGGGLRQHVVFRRPPRRQRAADGVIAVAAAAAGCRPSPAPARDRRHAQRATVRHDEVRHHRRWHRRQRHPPRLQAKVHVGCGQQHADKRANADGGNRIRACRSPSAVPFIALHSLDRHATLSKARKQRSSRLRPLEPRLCRCGILADTITPAASQSARYRNWIASSRICQVSGATITIAQSLGPWSSCCVAASPL